MITRKKLERMQDRVRARKLAIIFHDAAQDLHRGLPVELGYLRDLAEVCRTPDLLALLDDGARERLAVLLARLETREGEDLAFTLADLSSLCFSAIGAEPSDWDFTGEDGRLDPSRRTVADHVLVLDRIRSPFNVGSIFRSADAFGIARIILVEGTADVTHPRCLRTARGTTETVDHRCLSEEAVLAYLETVPCFALELGGTPIGSFPFPSRGACVIGSEEMGVSPALLAACARSLGRVSIPLFGTKGSLNVSVASGIMLSRWGFSS